MKEIKVSAMLFRNADMYISGGSCVKFRNGDSSLVSIDDIQAEINNGSKVVIETDGCIQKYNF